MARAKITTESIMMARCFRPEMVSERARLTDGRKRVLVMRVVMVWTTKLTLVRE